MLKRLSIIAAVAAVTAVAAVPAAHAIGAYAAWWNPKHSDSNGYGAGVRFTSSFTPLLGADLRASYISFSDSDAATIPVEATVYAKLGNMYGGVGYGYYSFTGDADIDNDWGWYLLAGIGLIPGPVSVFGEFKWQNLDPDKGGDFESYVFHAGVTFGK